MLTKYSLVNVRKGGVDHLVDGRRWSITDRLTDDQADYLINAGLGFYFRPKSKPSGKNSKAGGPAAKPATAASAGATTTAPNATGGIDTNATGGINADATGSGSDAGSEPGRATAASTTRTVNANG